MTTRGRGGKQHIPRPSSFRHGDPPPWSELPASLRHIDVARVRSACATLPPPRDAEAAGVPTRPAAVLVPVFEEDGEARVILTKRPEHMPHHQGQIAFPGGKQEQGDVDLRQTALREAREEIGLDPATVEIVGELDHLFTVSSTFVVTPYVGLLPGRPHLLPDPREVDAVLDVSLAELLAEDVFREEHWELSPGPVQGPGTQRSVHFFELVDETVWGATARILHGFLAHLATSVLGRDARGAAGVS